MKGLQTAAIATALIAGVSCVDARQHGLWCAEGKIESCTIACDHGDDAACLSGGKSLLSAVESHDAGPGDESRALAMFAHACEHGVAKACLAAARASDDGVSLAPLPWFERACRGGDVGSCRDAAATRLGAEEGACREAYTALCHLEAQADPRPAEPAQAKDEPACIAAWSARHATAARASSACDAGDARACEKLGDTLVGAAQQAGSWVSACAEVFAPGLSPLGGTLACERAGRAYARACSLRGLTTPPGPRMVTCPAWFQQLGRRREKVERAAAPWPNTTLTVTPGSKTPDAIAEAVKRIAPELLKCPPRATTTNQAPNGEMRASFAVDRTGRPAWVMVLPQHDATGDSNCLTVTLADADLSVVGDARTGHDLHLVFGGSD